VTSSAQARDTLIDALELDLIGPGPDDEHAEEKLSEFERPTRFYLTGFLVPTDAPETLARDSNSNETIDGFLDDEEPGDDAAAPESDPGRRLFLPTSIGLSALVDARESQLSVELLYGEYALGPAPTEQKPERKAWHRAQRLHKVTLELPAKDRRSIRVEVPDSKGLCLYLSVRTLTDAQRSRLRMSLEARSVSVFVVNERRTTAFERQDEAVVFQCQLRVRSARGFIERPDVHDHDTADVDARIADLQFRDACEFGVGHSVSAVALREENGRCFELRTCWVPRADVEKVVPSELRGAGLELSMEALSALRDPAALRAALIGVVDAYAAWIAAQRAQPLDAATHRETASLLLDYCDRARARIAAGITLLTQDAVARDAFCRTQSVMARANRQREAQQRGCAPAEAPAPRWRPFQLAFMLLNLCALTDRAHEDRAIVDLLFFPTGGGKTEAYLALAAYSMLLRRLRDPSPASGGVTVLMRYTLRLLTLDQLGRATTLLCAMELMRAEEEDTLGHWPFEIGLWVGKRATPTLMGRKGDNNKSSARHRTLEYKAGRTRNSPVPLESCPWCGTDLTPDSFHLIDDRGGPDIDKPTDLRLSCLNSDCAFSGGRYLPVLSVDEPIYRRLPAFLIATVDKFASLPWREEAGALLGRVQRFDRKRGYLRTSEGAAGSALPGNAMLAAPDLIIQDELHLISGPLGTMVGLYETAIDALSERTEPRLQPDGTTRSVAVRPKVIASTATVRRAREQIRALFDRESEVFPPPGPDRRDSFFARTSPPSERNPRRYVGVAAQGRSLKVVLLRVYLALLASAQKQYLAQGGTSPGNPVDPYMTLLGYFNALRELGGSRRIIEDEVLGRLRSYRLRHRLDESEGSFENRRIGFDVLELTSRVSTSEVAEAKRRLERPFSDERHVDVALATNMISVGLDIRRLGLMVVLGQPKTASEYIQATSRVGRDDERPGLVVVLMNIHRPRDRSHYERFVAFHETFYRSVEATSVTPYAPRALDRGLAAVTVAMARHGTMALSAPKAAVGIQAQRAGLSSIAERIARRAAAHDAARSSAEQDALSKRLTARVHGLLDAWVLIANEHREAQGGLQYCEYEVTGVPPLLRVPLDATLAKEPVTSPRRLFRAAWSLRDVEPEVHLLVKRLDGGEVEVARAGAVVSEPAAVSGPATSKGKGRSKKERSHGR
jgi:hypothetical protein